ncbi:glucose 1-dehydrogenase [Aquamicrobium sp. NLF2-7]|uniref:3-oxoacyl-[acyl-carrier protein] reductase n=1 Tax=Aquamicrobium lusatiense TaxID=89772 RepID=A0A7W9S6K1_9HYPH|nr:MULTISPECIES: glucose 1-dehydrogenase [Aquamicrobium]MBB6013943.1 3-oxoacyl-[acyl-carrier protein] reductase [Aquamicrobium lusatiense]MCG8273544.1 glucose 1-dehydrogenase [Aquamicrobium sp. NLF2-7]MCK9552589.1 glucose 1-dehydrogenase [Aquamicrobium sp.]
MRLTGKIAVITGGGSGFGEGIVRKFVAEGAKVVLMDRDQANAERVAQSLGDDCRPLVGDVATAQGMEAARDLALSAFGGLNVLVNNAGVGHVPTPLDDIDEATFDRIANVNMRSIYYGARAMVPHFKAQKAGAILNVASTGGVSPRPNLTWYNASKGWVITATRAMAVELAPFGIRVNAINPVAGDTPLLSTFMGADTPEIRAKFLASIPIGRFSTPEDMGNAAAFLCSEEASMITGIAMEVDGGRCI